VPLHCCPRVRAPTHVRASPLESSQRSLFSSRAFCSSAIAAFPAAGLSSCSAASFKRIVQARHRSIAELPEKLRRRERSTRRELWSAGDEWQSDSGLPSRLTSACGEETPDVPGLQGRARTQAITGLEGDYLHARQEGLRRLRRFWSTTALVSRVSRQKGVFAQEYLLRGGTYQEQLYTPTYCGAASSKPQWVGNWEVEVGAALRRSPVIHGSSTGTQQLIECSVWRPLRP
jgi:hypothetical protein